MRDRALFRNDGALRYVSYMRQSGARPKVIQVAFRKPGEPPLTTCFTLVDRDFAMVYEAAVSALADHLGIAPGSPLRERMRTTAGDFLRRYGLKTARVRIDVVVDRDECAKKVRT